MCLRVASAGNRASPNRRVSATNPGPKQACIPCRLELHHLPPRPTVILSEVEGSKRPGPPTERAVVSDALLVLYGSRERTSAGKASSQAGAAFVLCGCVGLEAVTLWRFGVAQHGSTAGRYSFWTRRPEWNHRAYGHKAMTRSTNLPTMLALCFSNPGRSRHRGSGAPAAVAAAVAPGCAPPAHT